MTDDGTKTSMGFYTTRWVEASTPEEAEITAIELIKNDHELKAAIINEKDAPPMLYKENISEIENFEGVNPPGAGYTFYRENIQ